MKINAQMLGTDATDQDAEQMAAALCSRGYDTEATSDAGMINGLEPVDIPDVVWDECILQGSYHGSKMITYDYTMTGGYADTIAILDDGRRMQINTQYARVYPLGNHAEGCAQVTKGHDCDCGLLADVDTEALIIDARANGKFGFRPLETVTVGEMPQNDGLCPKCRTYCYGDCE